MIRAELYETTNVIDRHRKVAANLHKVYAARWPKTLPLMVKEVAPLATERPLVLRDHLKLKEKGILNEGSPPQLQEDAHYWPAFSLHRLALTPLAMLDVS